MPFTLTNPDNFAAKQAVGTDVVMAITGDDRTISGSVDAYNILAQSTLTASAAAYLTPASGHDYIVASIMLSNPGATARVVTFYLDKAGTTYDATTQWGPSITLGAGEAAEWIDGKGWTVYSSTGIAKTTGGPTIVRAFFQPGQALATSETYVTNSDLSVPALVAGHVFRWRAFITKTAASTTLPVLSVYVGTNGSLSDTKRFTTGTLVWATALTAQTANIDAMCLEVEVQCVGAGASGSLWGRMKMERSNTALLGFSVNPMQHQHGVTGSIDLSAANLHMGLALTPAGTAAWTVNQIITEIFTP